jgi:3-hydroxybutyryl-CoA dehydrogenase
MEIKKVIIFGAGMMGSGIDQACAQSGLDATYNALMSIYETTSDTYWYPPAIMRNKVNAGHLGRKTGKGWYEYHEGGTRKTG